MTPHTHAFWKGKRALITGINGFLGSHLAHALAEAGAEVHGLVRDSIHTPYLQGLSLEGRVTLHAGNLKSRAEMEKLIAGQAWDIIFHLASQSDTTYSIQHPLETIEVNVLGTAHILEAIRTHAPTTPIIFGSSVRAFGKESAHDEIVHPYDASKDAMESIAKSYIHEYALQGAIVKNTNLFGPNDLHFTRLIPKIMKGILTQGKMELKGNGGIQRDFMFVQDAVNGILRLGEKLTQKEIAPGKSFVLATGKMTSIHELAELIQRVSLEKCAITFNETALQHERELAPLDLGPTQRELGWKSQYSLEQGVRTTMEWYRAYFAKLGGRSL